MRKKFLFLIPPSIILSEYYKLDTRSVWNRIYQPYGPLSIISYVTSHIKEVEFKIVDLRKLYYSQDDEEKANLLIFNVVSKNIYEFQPDFIGISTPFNTCYFHMHNIINAINIVNTNAYVLIGGGFATVAYQDILNEFEAIKIAIISEGEIPVLNLLKSDNPMQEYKKTPAIVTRQSLKESQVPTPQYINNLDEIPLLNLNINYELYGNNSTYIVTSRGCPYNCIFCAAHLITGKTVRYYSPERINQDIQRYYIDGYRHFNFFDDNFFFNRQRAKNILYKLIDLNKDNDISVAFPAGVMVTHIDEEDVVSLMSRLNLKELPLALESGSEKVLKIIKKPVTKKAFENVVQLLKKYNIKIRTFIVVGLPGETDADRKDTVNYLKEIGIDWTAINIAIPLYGSRLYEICVENSYLKNYEKKVTKMGTAYIETPEFSVEHIKEQAYLMNLDVNFINNNNVKIGKYIEALNDFKKIVDAIPNHAIAHYCLAKCYIKLNNEKEYLKHIDIFNEIINKDETWKKYSEYFNIRSNNETR